MDAIDASTAIIGLLSTVVLLVVYIWVTNRKDNRDLHADHSRKIAEHAGRIEALEKMDTRFQLVEQRFKHIDLKLENIWEHVRNGR